jgi:hypothetical protein
MVAQLIACLLMPVTDCPAPGDCHRLTAKAAKTTGLGAPTKNSI